MDDFRFSIDTAVQNVFLRRPFLIREGVKQACVVWSAATGIPVASLED